MRFFTRFLGNRQSHNKNEIAIDFTPRVTIADMTFSITSKSIISAFIRPETPLSDNQRNYLFENIPEMKAFQLIFAKKFESTKRAMFNTVLKKIREHFLNRFKVLPQELLERINTVNLTSVETYLSQKGISFSAPKVRPVNWTSSLYSADTYAEIIYQTGEILVNMEAFKYPKQSKRFIFIQGFEANIIPLIGSCILLLGLAEIIGIPYFERTERDREDLSVISEFLMTILLDELPINVPLHKQLHADRIQSRSTDRISAAFSFNLSDFDELHQRILAAEMLFKHGGG